ncbi:MAG: hypothetical protein U1E65_05470 [Myxococcota bacterium]
MLGYLGRPHRRPAAIPPVADPEITHALAELGVILQVFSLGLEFSLRQHR